MLEIDQKVIDCINSVYVTNKFSDSSWKIGDVKLNDNTSRVIRLSKGFYDVLSISSHKEYIILTLFINKDSDLQIVKEMNEHLITYKGTCEVFNNRNYIYHLKFDSSIEFNIFFDKYIVPKFGFKESDTTFSWI